MQMLLLIIVGQLVYSVSISAMIPKEEYDSTNNKQNQGVINRPATMKTLPPSAQHKKNNDPCNCAKANQKHCAASCPPKKDAPHNVSQND